MVTKAMKHCWAFILRLFLLIPVPKDLGRQAGGFVGVSEMVARLRLPFSTSLFFWSRVLLVATLVQNISHLLS